MTMQRVPITGAADNIGQALPGSDRVVRPRDVAQLELAGDVACSTEATRTSTYVT